MAAQPYTVADTVWANPLLIEAQALVRKANYKVALPKLDSVLRVQEAVFPEGSKDMGAVLRLTGRCHTRTGDPKKGKSFMERAKPIVYRFYGEADVFTAGLEYELGEATMALGDYAPTLEQYLKAETMYLAIEGEKSASLLTLYSNIAICHYNLGRIDRAIEYALKVIPPLEAAKNYKTLATSYHNLGNFYRFSGQPVEGERFYRKALESCKLSGTENSLTAGMIWNNLGTTLVGKGDFRTGMEYLLKGQDIKENATDYRYPLTIATGLRDIGNAYRDAGDYAKALQCHQKALRGLLQFSATAYKDLAANYYALGHDYFRMNEPDRAILFLEKTLQASRLAHPDSRSSTEINACTALGTLFLRRGDLGKAKATYERARQMAQENPDEKSRESPGIYLGLAACAAAERDAQRTIEMGQRDIAISKKNLGDKTTHTAQYRVEFAQCLVDVGEWAAAQSQLDSVLTSLDWHTKPNFSDLNRVALVTSAFELKGRAMLRQHSPKPSAAVLRQILAVGAEIDRLFPALRQAYSYGESREMLTQSLRTAFGNAIAANLMLHGETDSAHYLHRAFVYAEKTKSLRLYEGVQESNALKYSAMPDSILDREHNLRVDIADYEKHRFDLESKGANPTDSTLLTLNSHVFDLHQAYETFQKTLETDYPDYYRLKYDLRVEDVASVQRDLLYPDMALVEYFVGDSAVYIFTIRKNDYSVQEVKKDFPLETWVAQLRTGLTAFHTDPTLATWYDTLSGMYTDAAFKIYQKLVAPIAAQLPKYVVFVPDGVLGYVPFEALLVEKPLLPTRWNTHRYLLNDHTVSYCYSATMLREMRYRKHKQQPELGFLGFAPQYDGDTNLLSKLYPYTDDMRKALKPLPHSGEEVYRSAKIMQGQAFVGADATEARFNEMAGQARILHLATHGQANDRSGDYCFLAFEERKDSLENELLYARDIYNLSLNADLVTLSACETGIGELQNGEGIISLARAFAYAGAKSIVTSLWSVSDAKTKDLMVDFYKNLRRGGLKDEALRQAKLDYLKRNKGQAAHPFFWAGFIGIGDMAPVRR